MKKIMQVRGLIFLALACALLAGCATTASEPASLFDLGPLPAAQPNTVALPPLGVAEVNAPAWLDSPRMYYRLAYANDQQPRPYASSRWLMAPAQLFGQRVKARIAQAGGVAISATDGAVNVTLLRIEADDFMQTFDAPGKSLVQVSIRATVFDVRSVIAQKSFSGQVAASTADAAGGAKALATASDAVITDMITWLGTLRLKKP